METQNNTNVQRFKFNYKPPMFVCSCCGEAKPLKDYYTQSYTGQPTGQCKQCINIKRGVQRHKAKHGKFISKERVRGMEEPDFTLQDWKDSMLHFKGGCAFCSKPEGRAKADKMDRDHIVALARGGKTVRNNIAPACKKCNRGRGAREWRAWFREQDFWDPEREARIQNWIDQ